LILLLGIVVLPSNALKPVESGSSAASAESNAKPTTGGERTTIASPGKKGDSEGTKPGLIDRYTYHLDLFLPVDLGVTDEWEPQGGLREIYVLGFRYSVAF